MHHAYFSVQSWARTCVYMCQATRFHTPMSEHETRYPPIADYALISDCHCNALVSRSGSVDWCCMPRIDDDSCFGRLLDWDKGGYCSVTPSMEYTAERAYVDGTMILETRFATAHGEARLTDFFVMNDNDSHQPRYDHVRIIDGLSGEVELRIEVCPRFDYGEIMPYIQRYASGVYTATGSNKGLIIHTDAQLEVIKHRDLVGTCRVRAGQRIRLAIEFEMPELIEQSVVAGAVRAEDIDRDLEGTRTWWQKWIARIHDDGVDAQTMRSTIVLKSLTFDRTGAIAAASTTSLPEEIGGERNWDYRFSWIRDSVFTIRALHELGYVSEADRFHQFIQRSAAGSAEQLQIMYAVDGKRRLTEVELCGLEGYRHSRPVRIGNGAARQVQLDIYGELMEMAWEWHRKDHQTEPDYWNFLADVVDVACHRWSEKDHGFWEVRGAPRHYVHSKVMCWAAIERGVELAKENDFPAPIERWSRIRDEIRAAIESEGCDAQRGVFVQSFGSTDMDAVLLLLPRVGFVPYDDPRMLRTVDAIRGELDHGGLLRRYTSPDHLRGSEGVFLACTFWLARCLAMQGRQDLAFDYYNRAAACSNDLGLFSEEFHIDSGQMLGNFPQGLTHVSQIMAKRALDGLRQDEKVNK